MKNLGILTIVVLISILQVFGQESNVGEVTEQVRFMSKGENNAFSIVIYGADLKSTASYWEKYAKRFKGKTKTDKKTGEVFTDDAKLPDISANTVDVYARFIEQSTNEIAIYSWYNLGGAFLNSTDHPEKSAKASTILTEFARFVAQNNAQVVLEIEEKALKDLERDLDKLQRDNTQMHKKIEDAEALIAKLEMEIKQNLESQAAKKDEINVQQASVDSAKGEQAKYR